MNDAFLCLGASYHQLPLIKAANAIGLTTVAFDQNSNSPGLKLAKRGYPTSSRDVDQIIGRLRFDGIKPIGVSTLGSDIPDVVGKLARHYDIPGPTERTWTTCTDKVAQKKALQEAGVEIPAFAEVASVDDLDAFVRLHGRDVILKPVDRSGSRGVVYLGLAQDRAEAFRQAKQTSFSGRVMAEERLHGIQLSTEMLCWGGKYHHVACAERNYFDPRIRIQTDMDEQVMENGGVTPSPLDESGMVEVRAIMEASAKALGIESHVCKGDLVWTSRGVFVLEIAARLGGPELCARLVPSSTGVDYITEVVRMATGLPPRDKALEPSMRRHSAVRYLFGRPGILRAIKGLRVSQDGLEYIRNLPGLHDFEVYANDGDTIYALRSHADRIASFCVVADDRESLRSRISAAYGAAMVVSE